MPGRRQFQLGERQMGRVEIDRADAGHKLHAMRQSREFDQHLQHRGLVEPQQRAGRQRSQGVELVMNAVQREVAHRE